jgi:hypothetical protein
MNAAEEARLEPVVDQYVAEAAEKGLYDHTERCLRTERWEGDVVLMVVDAAFTSVGLDYFNTVVPAVLEFEASLVESRTVATLAELAEVRLDTVEDVWANRRSWQVARGVAEHLATMADREAIDDRDALRRWAEGVDLQRWDQDPIGGVSGVGINTVQYLRMMGGVDTAMPDSIVRRVIDRMLEAAAVDLPTAGDLDLVRTIDRIAAATDHRSIELCWLTWLVESEGDLVADERYRDVLDRI